MFVYELSGCGCESSCSHLNFRFHAYFEQGVPWHSGNYSVWIYSGIRMWPGKGIQFDHIVVTKQDTLFHRITYDYSYADWDGLRDYLRDVRWEDIFKPSASAAASEFYEWIQFGIDIHIPHHKYQASLTNLHGFKLLVLLP